MLTAATHDLLTALRRGQFDPASVPAIESLSASTFIADMRKRYDVVFQERTVGRKHEIGLAQEVAWALRAKPMKHSRFADIRLVPSLERCLLISSYGDEISELTWVNRIHLRPPQSDSDGLIVRFGKGFKLDKTVDGWIIKSLLHRKVALSEGVLKKHGWQFDVFAPFWSPEAVNAGELGNAILDVPLAEPLLAA